MNSSNTISGVGPYDQLIQQYQQLQSQSQFRMGQISAVGPHGDQDLKSQSPEPVIDEFGLRGLLKVIRMNNPDLTSPALGIDLTTLGLNLNASDDLHKRFASPWAEEPHKGEPQYSIPECYYAKQPPVLNVSSSNLTLCSYLKNAICLLFSFQFWLCCMCSKPILQNYIWRHYFMSFTACREKRHCYMQHMNCMLEDGSTTRSSGCG